MFSVTQLCRSLCGPMDFSPPGSSVYGIFQTRILEWVAIFSSRGSSWPRDLTWVSYISCVGRQNFFFNHQWHLRSTKWAVRTYKKDSVKLIQSCLPLRRASHVAQWWRIRLPMQTTQVWRLGQEDPLEEETATHSSILAWEIPWTEEPSGLQSIGSQKIWTQIID